MSSAKLSQISRIELAALWDQHNIILLAVGFKETLGLLLTQNHTIRTWNMNVSLFEV